MWNEVKNSNDITEVMERLAYFHDSCLKELKYVSGAYIEGNAMQPLNEKRMLSIIIHCGVADIDAIEMEFRTISGNPRQFNYRDESAGLCISAH